MGMLKELSQTQSSLEFVCIDELVPQDYLLRYIEVTVGFNFILPPSFFIEKGN